MMTAAAKRTSDLKCAALLRMIERESEKGECIHPDTLYFIMFNVTAFATH